MKTLIERLFVLQANFRYKLLIWTELNTILLDCDEDFIVGN